MQLGKVIRELDVEPDEELVPTPEKAEPDDAPTNVPDALLAPPAKVPACAWSAAAGGTRGVARIFRAGDCGHSSFRGPAPSGGRDRTSRRQCRPTWNARPDARASRGATAAAASMRSAPSGWRGTSRRRP